MNSKKSLVELLAPCGSPETLDAAIIGGADAIYLGGRILNARMNAKNFTDDDLIKAVDKCHRNGVKLYITLNTLVYDKEFNEAVRYAAKLFNLGVDAFIVADIGLAVMLKNYIPDIELHASTQMSGHNTNAALKLAELEFTRMVCARELNVADLKQLVKQSPIEIEMFVHGAYCVSISGQCLMSSFIGGRSGNRGDCAQPCRMKYNNGYPLSLKDMCLAGHITEILESGVKSLKIEGRMKSPDYVYTVTSTYRKLIDENRDADSNEINKLSKIFSRSGFTDGYFTGRINQSMLGVRTDSNKNDTRNIKTEFTQVNRQFDPIITKPCDVNLPETKIKPYTVNGKAKIRKSARFLYNQQIPENHDFDIVYLPLDKFTKFANGVILPSVIKDCEINEIKIALEKSINQGAEHILIGNLGHIDIVKEYGLILHGDFRLNIYNNATMKYYGMFDDNILSPELTLPQIRDIGGNKCVIIYGKIALMILERPLGVTSVKDRMNAEFPIHKEGKREIISNTVPIYMADKKTDLNKFGIVNTQFIFTDESKSEVSKIIEAYDKGLPYNKNFKRIKQ